MNDPFSNLESMVAASLANQQGATAEGIRALIDNLRQLPMFDGVVTEEDAERLAKRFEERVSITQHLGSILIERGHLPWLDAARARIEPYYWNRYSQHLTQEGFPSSVVATLDEVTDRVLGLMQDPLRDGPWDRRGMVVGHVQSGKTSNYTGLICKAADAGYKLIVIIAGVHNNLRSQTQRRIDEGFVGRDSARLLSKQADMFVGVGQFDVTRRPVTFTNTLRDFNKMTATGVGIPLQNLNEPAVFVIKKNSSTLKNLIEWLTEHSSRGGAQSIDEPMLLIDDEADNASINIRYGAGEVSRINGQIRLAPDLLRSGRVRPPQDVAATRELRMTDFRLLCPGGFYHALARYGPDLWTPFTYAGLRAPEAATACSTRTRTRRWSRLARSWWPPTLGPGNWPAIPCPAPRPRCSAPPTGSAARRWSCVPPGTWCRTPPDIPPWAGRSRWVCG